MTLPNIRVNVKANFPALITGTGIIAISKANGVWSIGASFEQLPTLPQSLISGAILIPTQDPVSGNFFSVSVTSVFGVGSLVSRIVTAGAVIAAQTSDGDILVNLASPSAVTVNLPASLTATRPVSVKDLAGNASTDNITIFPSGAETIDGLASAVIATDGGALTFYPLPGGGGWYLK
jgi:hypothetical protein